MDTKQIDIIAESGLDGKDFAFACRTMMHGIMKKGRDRAPEQDADEWERISRFAKAGALLGNGDCMSTLADIIYGKKTEEARACEDSLAEAVKWWSAAADAGNGRGATNLGLLYLNKEIPGAGAHGTLEYDEEKAFEYFVRGYECGDMKAGRHVGLCYKEGIGTEQDLVKAFEWYGKAAERGDSSAALFIADCKLKGEGTEQDVADAIERYKALVECNGHDVTNAAFTLATLYQSGEFVERDPEMSKFYYESVVRTATPREMHLKEAAEKALADM